MYKAVFIDIDGTLIKSDHSLSELTIDTIKKTKALGIIVVLVSARPLNGITAISHQLGLSDVPIASLNGSYIAINDQVLYNCTINDATLIKLYNDLLPYPVSIIYYDQLQWYSEEENRFTINEQKITQVPIKISSFDQLSEFWKANNTGPNKLLVIGEEEVIKNIQLEVSPHYSGQLNMYTSKPIYLEVMDKAASKMEAIKFFMNKYNLLREETIAIGDNFNDIEMIQFAGLGIAMGNAPEPVKSIADHVTLSNNQDGVSLVLNRIFLS